MRRIEQLFLAQAAVRAAYWNGDYELGVQDATIKGLRRQLAEIEAVVDQQANDEGLWCEAETCAESYIQQALRRLHAAIERKSPDDCAIAALKQNGKDDHDR